MRAVGTRCRPPVRPVSAAGTATAVTASSAQPEKTEELLLDQVLAIGPVTDARSTFAIRTVRSRGPLPLRQWPP